VKLGLFGDVHANLPALEAVLAALGREDVDSYLCTGDLVGYGPNPNECIRMVRELGVPAVAGNHDLIALGRLSYARCIPFARRTLAWTTTVLGAEEALWLSSLPLRLEEHAVAVAHGSLASPEEYVAHRRHAVRVLRASGARTLVLGHTHRPLRARADEALLVNPGAVGQSRELRARARCAILDVKANEVRFLAVPYDVERVRADLRSAGLPEQGPHLRPSVARATARALRAWL